ncbi:MAG: hypothetical protein A2079_01620 [Geobacteraceae bacterium GWC2_48_7]|nr:MAG: hypothetical protein A2079_01620 [Geobacteraceae bacterium GWC2_48_7]
MKKESILFAVIALIVGLLGGYLVFSISSAGKSGTSMQQPAAVGGTTPADYAARIAEAEKVVAQDPKNLNAWISLGNDYFDTEQAQKAINAYSKALEIQPDNPNVLTDQGVMFRKVGWFDKAAANFEKAYKLDPKHLQSLFNLGIVYSVDMKQPEKAKAVWTKYLQIDPSSQNAAQIREMMSSAGGSKQPGMK